MEPERRLSGWQFLRQEAARKGWAGHALFGTLFAFSASPTAVFLAMQRTGWAALVLGLAGLALFASMALFALGLQPVQDYVTGEEKGDGGGEG